MKAVRMPRGKPLQDYFFYGFAVLVLFSGINAYFPEILKDFQRGNRGKYYKAKSPIKRHENEEIFI